ncbi:MAG TPA: FlgD immunoglobulin-like domain containing protein [Steroidobacteraceae bacterium]|nr:FlgD immunoglobulin-like domain containing protein [Steroidobacteraceae bacterium]
MSTTHPVTGSTIPSASSSSAIPVNMQINQADFLQLITAQLKDQNPMSPADPTQFVSQLEGMSEVSSMQNMQNSLAASQIMNGTTLLGHSVLAPGATASLAAGGAIAGAVTAPQGASQLTVSITDSSGNPVTSFKVTPNDSGLTPFSWNGTTSTGTAAPAGQYNIAVSASVNGSSQQVDPMVISKVSTVTIDPTSQSVDVNTDSGIVPLSSIVAVM